MFEVSPHTALHNAAPSRAVPRRAAPRELLEAEGAAKFECREVTKLAQTASGNTLGGALLLLPLQYQACAMSTRSEPKPRQKRFEHIEYGSKCAMSPSCPRMC